MEFKSLNIKTIQAISQETKIPCFIITFFIILLPNNFKTHNYEEKSIINQSMCTGTLC